MKRKQEKTVPKQPSVESAASERLKELDRMSERELEALVSPGPQLSGKGGGSPGHPLKIPPGILSQLVLLFMQLPRYRSASTEELFPRAYQLFCDERAFLSMEPEELTFSASHGRRWGPGDRWKPEAGIDRSKLLPEPRLILDPAKLEASCRVFREQFKAVELPKRDRILANWIWEAYEILKEEYGIDRQDFKSGTEPVEQAEGDRPFVFTGLKVTNLLREYLVIRSMGSRSAERAKRLFLRKIS
jgi:hypothetical protein